VGMMVTGRKVSETAETVRYEFGLDRQFDRVLTIDKETWNAVPDDGLFDSSTGAVLSKIKRAWQDQGEFPPGVVFAS
jgi:hypothetical protein